MLSKGLVLCCLIMSLKEMDISRFGMNGIAGDMANDFRESSDTLSFERVWNPSSPASRDASIATLCRIPRGSHWCAALPSPSGEGVALATDEGYPFQLPICRAYKTHQVEKLGAFFSFVNGLSLYAFLLLFCCNRAILTHSKPRGTGCKSRAGTPP